MEEASVGLTVSEAAKRLGVNADTVRRYIREGKLIATLLGGDSGGYRIPENDIARMLAGLPVTRARIRLTQKHGGPITVSVGGLLSVREHPSEGTLVILQGGYGTTLALHAVETQEEVKALIDAAPVAPPAPERPRASNLTR